MPRARKDDTVYDEYLEALVSGDHRKCSRIVREKRKSSVPIKDIYTELFQRSLYHVGELWVSNRISVATEHMATSITEGIMNSLYTDIDPVIKVPKKVVVASVEGEQHQVGAKMVADIFEMKGWNSFYLGANTPTEELIRFCKEISPDLIGLSLSVYFHMDALQAMIARIREHFPLLPVLVGGQAFRHGAPEIESAFENVTYVATLDDLEKFIAAQ